MARALSIMVIIFTFFIFFRVNASASNQERLHNIVDISKWVGKYPFDTVVTVEGEGIFSIKAFRAGILNILPPKKHEEVLSIQERGPQTPIQKTGEILHFTVCEAHNCGHMFYFFVRPDLSQIFICERTINFGAKSSSELNLSSVWYGPRTKVKFHNQQCEVVESHGSEINWVKTISSIPKEIQ